MRILTLALFAFTAPAVAQQQTFSLPGSCTAFLTVQSSTCTVSHHFTCANDPTGVQGRVDLDQAGPVYIGSIDAEAQWINSFDPLSGSTETLVPGPVDPASFTELTGTGTDGYDFEIANDQAGTIHFVGRDTLTGNTVTIDGITLEETEYQIAALAEDGTEMWRTTGSEYISRDWRMFMSGTSKTITPTDSFESDDSPVEFIFPGEPGFLSANPKHGCGAVTSQANTNTPLIPVGFPAP